MDRAVLLALHAGEIAWQTALLAARNPQDDTPLVAIRQLTDRAALPCSLTRRGSCEVLHEPPRCSTKWD